MPYFPWGTSWTNTGGWCAPWTGATGPGVLVAPRPPPHQAYFSQPTTMASWDTTGLIQALQTASLQQPSNGEWYMDSGASTHMTGDQGNLPLYFPSSLHNSSHIVVGNGSLVPIHGTGTTDPAHIKYKFCSFQCLAYTPPKNLIFVRKFTKDNACSVEFDPSGFSVKDLQTRKEILRS